MKHPYQQVAITKSGHLAATCTNHVYVFDQTLGARVGQWTDPIDRQLALKAKVAAEGKTTKVAEPGDNAPVAYDIVRILDTTATQLLTATDLDKAVELFNFKENELDLIRRQPCPKRPSAGAFVTDNEVVVADKFGDVYVVDSGKEIADPKKMEPVLGHVLLLNLVVMAEHDGKKYIITGDRDEHVRVLHYPQLFVIKHWLFGHSEFVAALHIPQLDPELLFSAGGDDYVCVWKWYDNELVTKIDVALQIKPYLGEAHLPAERFRTPELVPEMVVTRLQLYQQQLFVLVEQTPVVLVYNFDGSFSHKIEALALITDFAVDPTTGTVYAAVDTDDDAPLIEGFTATGDKVTVPEFSHDVDIELRLDVYPLYPQKVLRKHGEY